MTTSLPDIIEQNEMSILKEWLQYQKSATRSAHGAISDTQLQHESGQFLTLLKGALAGAQPTSLDEGPGSSLRDLLGDLSRSRALQGFTPSETAAFVLSLKRPLFDRVSAASGKDAAQLADHVWRITDLLDRLALHTSEVFQKSREEIIQRQQQEMLELSTPVIQLWDGVLAVPLIGTLDSARTQVVMESLLTSIVDTGATIAIIDITGVPTVDTLVAQHLLKTVAAARLMGADCIISGIRPQIAQTIVHLGVNLGDVITKATLSGALQVALNRRGLKVVRPAAG